MYRFAQLLILSGVVCVIGCRSIYPQAIAFDSSVERGDRTDQPTRSQTKLSDSTAPSIWPERWGSSDSDTGVIRTIEHPYAELVPAHLSRFHQLRSGETEYKDMATLAAGLGIERSYKFQAEGAGCYLFVHSPPIGDQESPKLMDGEPELFFKFISAQYADDQDGQTTAEDHVELERTWFTYRTPKDDEPAIGTLVLMPGMFGTPEPVIEGLERYVRSKGWAVLRMLSHPSRFTERQQFAVHNDREAELAKQIAEMFDTRTAEAAFAASAGLKHVHGQFPDHAEKPVVLLGMSGGAMILPTVYMYDQDLYDAGIMIAGGGNFLEINTRSNYAKWIDAIDLDADPSDPEIQRPETDQLKRLTKLYLSESKLDSLHSAYSMHSTPVLMLHANNDKAVPASTGDALYEALGKPERWVYPVGHELIFAGLPLQIPKIERWMREQVIED